MMVATLVALAVGAGRLDGDDPSLRVRVPVGHPPAVLASKEAT